MPSISSYCSQLEARFTEVSCGERQKKSDSAKEVLYDQQMTPSLYTGWKALNGRALTTFYWNFWLFSLLTKFYKRVFESLVRYHEGRLLSELIWRTIIVNFIKLKNKYDFIFCFLANVPLFSQIPHTLGSLHFVATPELELWLGANRDWHEQIFLAPQPKLSLRNSSPRALE